MSGIIYVPEHVIKHKCLPPQDHGYRPGTIWACDCGALHVREDALCWRKLGVVRSWVVRRKLNVDRTGRPR